jgi:hypothetical protein
MPSVSPSPTPGFKDPVEDSAEGDRSFSVFPNHKILYRGRSAQRFRDPGFLGIVNPENDAVYLPLKKGQNEMVLAVSEMTGGWGFICRFDDMDRIH